MRARSLMVGVVAAGIVWGMVDESQAWPRWMRRADRNRDGRIEPAERKEAARVNTPAEAKADRNNDGVVGPNEARRAELAARSKVNRPWEAAADTDKDGRVSAAELRKFRFAEIDADHDGKIEPAERKAFWAKRRFAVNTPLEKKYDTNADGFLTGDEAVEYMKDRIRVIRTDGKAIVNNPLEAEFDADNDGVISAEEAEAIRDSVGE